MQAVVPAAGEGTRLRPVTQDRPKGLVEVAGAPMLAYCFDGLRSLGVNELLVVVGHQAEAIMHEFGHAYEGIPITYVTQREPRGLAHAVRTVTPHVTGSFVVHNGDNVFDANLADAVAHHRAHGSAATLLVDRVSREEAAETGVVEVGPDGWAERVVEKPSDPASRVVTTGFGVFDPLVLSACTVITPSERGEYELADALTALLVGGHRVGTVPLKGWRVNVNTPEDLTRLEARLEGT